MICEDVIELDTFQNTDDSACMHLKLNVDRDNNLYSIRFRAIAHLPSCRSAATGKIEAVCLPPADSDSHGKL